MKQDSTFELICDTIEEAFCTEVYHSACCSNRAIFVIDTRRARKNPTGLNYVTVYLNHRPGMGFSMTATLPMNIRSYSPELIFGFINEANADITEEGINCALYSEPFSVSITSCYPTYALSPECIKKSVDTFISAYGVFSNALATCGHDDDCTVGITSAYLAVKKLSEAISEGCTALNII